jgi:enolase
MSTASIEEDLRGVDATRPGRESTSIMLEPTAPTTRAHGRERHPGVSLAVAKAAAASVGLPLYQYHRRRAATHAAGADDERPQRRRPRRQQRGHPGVHDHAGGRAHLLARRCATGVEIFHTLKKILGEKGLATAVGDEGGFAPTWAATARRWSSCMEAIEKAGYRPGEDIVLALDVAASEFFKDGAYNLEGRRAATGLSGRRPHRVPTASW